MKEIDRPENRLDAPELEQTPEKLREMDIEEDSFFQDVTDNPHFDELEVETHSDLERDFSLESSDDEIKSLADDCVAEESNKNTDTATEHSSDSKNETVLESSNSNEQRDVTENEIISRYSRENFKEEDSFHSRSKIEHPELNDLKQKCVYDTPEMGTPSEQIDRSPKAEYTQEERDHLKDIRDTIDAPTESTTMQKVIGVDTGYIQKDLSNYLEPKDSYGEDTDAQVFGFVSKAEDSVPFTKTPQECHDNLRLDYKETPYNNPEQSVYTIRFNNGINYDIPYDKSFDGNEDYSHPCTGNGFAASKDVTIPEYVVQRDRDRRGAIVTDGEIYRINPDGTEEKIAYFDDEGHRFKLCKEVVGSDC